MNSEGSWSLELLKYVWLLYDIRLWSGSEILSAGLPQGHEVMKGKGVTKSDFCQKLTFLCYNTVLCYSCFRKYFANIPNSGTELSDAAILQHFVPEAFH